MAQRMKVEIQIRELFFIPWLLLIADFFRGAAALPLRQKRRTTRGWLRPPLKVLPF